MSFYDVDDQHSPQLPTIRNICRLSAIRFTQACSDKLLAVSFCLYCFQYAMWVSNSPSSLSSCVLKILTDSKYVFFLFPFSFKLPHCSHSPPIVFSVSFCGTTSLLPDVSSLSGTRFSRIHYNIRRLLLSIGLAFFIVDIFSVFFIICLKFGNIFCFSNAPLDFCAIFTIV